MDTHKREGKVTGRKAQHIRNTIVNSDSNSDKCSHLPDPDLAKWCSVNGLCPRSQD